LFGKTPLKGLKDYTFQKFVGGMAALAPPGYAYGTPYLMSTLNLDHALTLSQRSGTYGSRARCGSFDDGIWLA